MRRREFLVGTGKMAAGWALQNSGLSVRLPGWMRRKPAAAKEEVRPYRGVNSLRAHGTARGLLVGCGVDVARLGVDVGYAGLIRDQANLVAAAGPTTWAKLRPAADGYEFEDADKLIAFAETNRMRVRGGALCSHRELPGWFAAEATEKNARELLTSHIERVAGRYAGRMHSWDVVREAVLVESGRQDGLRASPWLRLVGEEYIEVAFHAARAADAQALLTLNEFGMEGEDREAERKRVAMIALLRRMKARNVPVDAVGVESHLDVGQVYGAGLKSFLGQVRELGLQVLITEMDSAGGEAGVAAGVCGRYLEWMLKDGNVTAVVAAGIGVLFDPGGRPAEAFFAVRDAVDGRVEG